MKKYSIIQIIILNELIEELNNTDTKE